MDSNKQEIGHNNTTVAVWDALQACIVRAGIMHPAECAEVFAVWQHILAHSSSPARSNAEHSGSWWISSAVIPYILTAPPGHPPTAALRWDWDCRRASDFTAWCMATLHDRFGVGWLVAGEDDDAELGPHYLRLTLNEQEERCDWRYLNQHRWMDAFCTIADRLLKPVGVTALALETGWFDTVLCFCWREQAAEVLRWFPEAE